jgi:hypothetical protein
MDWYFSMLRRPLLIRLLAVVLLALTGLLYVTHAYGANNLLQRSLEVGNSQAGAVTIYATGFDISSPEVLGSIQVEFCASSPLFGTPCTAPSGFDVSGAALSSQNGETGFIILPGGTNSNTIVLSRVPAMTTATTVNYALSNVTNPSAVGSYYARIQTFTSADASGLNTDFGGLAYSINGAVQVSTTVPPYLLFCSGVTINGFDCSTASGSYINMGILSSQSTASAQSQLVTATNAANGFNITVDGLTMTSGNNIISALINRDLSRPGTSQFGINLVTNATPLVGQSPTGPGLAMPANGYNQPDFYKFTSGDTIAGASAVDDFRKLTASYVVNIQNGQPVGVYVATLTYICLANF